MMDTDPGDSFDQWLKQTLRDRPLPRLPRALATRARARAMEQGAGAVMEHLASRWRWGSWINALAGVVAVGLFAVLAATMLPSVSATSADPYSTQVDPWEAEGSAAESSGLATSEALLLGGAVLVGSILLLTIERALSDDGRRLIQMEFAGVVPR